MKTTTLIAIGVLSLGQIAFGAGHPRTTSLDFRHHARARQTHRPSAIAYPALSGAIPRAFRAGNPIQMFNPLAPAEYGTAEENVTFDPEASGKGNGIKLFSISF